MKSWKHTHFKTRRTSHTVNPANWHWRNFSPVEMSCRCCGETYHWPDFMDRLQQARTAFGEPFQILSAHRCSFHNANVGGAPLSQHLKLAVDIALTDHDRWALYQTCREAGFTGFGFYNTFLHIDLGHPRQWYGSNYARKIWQKS